MIEGLCPSLREHRITTIPVVLDGSIARIDMTFLRGTRDVKASLSTVNIDGGVSGCLFVSVGF